MQQYKHDFIEFALSRNAEIWRIYLKSAESAPIFSMLGFLTPGAI